MLRTCWKLVLTRRLSIPVEYSISQKRDPSYQKWYEGLYILISWKPTVTWNQVSVRCGMIPRQISEEGVHTLISCYNHQDLVRSWIRPCKKDARRGNLAVGGCGIREARSGKPCREEAEFMGTQSSPFVSPIPSFEPSLASRARFFICVSDDSGLPTSSFEPRQGRQSMSLLRPWVHQSSCLIAVPQSEIDIDNLLAVLFYIFARKLSILVSDWIRWTVLDIGRKNMNWRTRVKPSSFAELASSFLHRMKWS